jgi:two-component system response regulator NreC
MPPLASVDTVCLMGEGPGPETGRHAGPKKVRIVLAEDHRVVRRGLQLVLDSEPAFEVVAQVGDIGLVRGCLRKHAPDVLVLDLNRPGGASLPMIPQLRTEMPNTQIVVLTVEKDVEIVREVRRAGALGFVRKEDAESDLVQAIRAAAAGQGYLNRQLAARLVASRSATELPD